jgi:hypothetical protein
MPVVLKGYLRFVCSFGFVKLPAQRSEFKSPLHELMKQNDEMYNL